MNIRRIEIVCVIGVVLIGLSIAGCGRVVTSSELAPKINLGATIGSLAEVFAFEVIGVEGYALVGGLRGTGSIECPPHIRAYLKKYILKQLPGHKNIDEFISSRDTAVVVVGGLMPAISENQYFDVRVVALAGTQTTSLEGGELWGAELYEKGKFGVGARVLAKAEGPIFIDTIIDATGTDGTSETNKKRGYVLAGGRTTDEYKINLALRRPDYRTASGIRNRLNERFGETTAKAISAGLIELKVPAEYRGRKQQFISIVKATYLVETPEITKERIKTFIRQLAVSENKEQSEIALEAIGNESVGKLAGLLKLSDEQVRLRAGRCMLNLGSDEGLDTLRQIAMDKSSPYRIEALEAITTAANRNNAAAISRILLRDDDFDIQFAAYATLRKLENIAITQKLIARNFYLERIVQAGHKTIFVSRSGQPRIVLFGSPIVVRDNVFVQSADENITINVPAGQKYVSIIRKHPRRPNVTVQLKSTFEIGDVIRALCEEPLSKEYRGLGVSYAEVIGLLKQMCDKGAVQAEFRAGPLPGFD